MYQGAIKLNSAMLWTVGFIITFVGGMTGVLLAVPGANFVLHNSLIARFHNVIIGGVVFGCCGPDLLVPEILRLHAERKMGHPRSGSGLSASSPPSCRCTHWALWA